MKKLFLFAIAIGLACSARASYLIWQVNDSDSDVSGWNAAMLYQVSGTTSASIDEWNANKLNAMEGATLVASNFQVTGTTIGSTDLGSAVGTMPPGVSAAASIIGTGDGYAYYIELVNYDFDNDEVKYVHARSDAVSYAAMSGSITDSLSVTTIANIAPWHGTPFTAVPEPTSGLLMLFGAAMLGLKRKNRSRA